jgi:hypothetical protein
MLETQKCDLAGYLNPEIAMAEIAKTSSTKDPNLYKRLARNVLPSGYEAKRGQKRRSVYRSTHQDKAVVSGFQPLCCLAS